MHPFSMQAAIQLLKSIIFNGQETKSVHQLQVSKRRRTISEVGAKSDITAEVHSCHSPPISTTSEDEGSIMSGQSLFHINSSFWSSTSMSSSEGSIVLSSSTLNSKEVECTMQTSNVISDSDCRDLLPSDSPTTTTPLTSLDSKRGANTRSVTLPLILSRRNTSSPTSEAIFSAPLTPTAFTTQPTSTSHGTRNVCHVIGGTSPISTFSASSSETISSPRPSQRYAPPKGKRRVYTCTAEYGFIQIECHYGGTTCIYDETLPKSREALIKLPGVFPRYLVCLLEQISYSTLDHIWEDVECFLRQEISPCDDQHNFEVVQSLMRLQRYVANCVHYKIGKLISELSESQNTPRNSIVCSICNEAGKAKEQKYTSLLARCSQAGCNQCTSARVFDSLGRLGTMPVTPCVHTQACCRLLEMDYQNFTPTFFRQCAEVASLPNYSPLVRSCEAQCCVRTALTPLAGKSFRHNLPSLISGCIPVFSLCASKSAVEAVQYSDGDGGYIVLEHFELLEKYIHSLHSQLEIVFLQEHGYHMVPFREQYHDALELGHEYEIVTEEQQLPKKHKWGYEALILARQNIAYSVRLWVVPASVDASGQRLLVELFTLEDGELMPRSTGVRLIEAGLSHLTENSPVPYKEAWRKALQQKIGIHEYHLGSKPELHPIQLKKTLNAGRSANRSISSSITVDIISQDNIIKCSVRNNPSAPYLNEANIWILKSTITNAGLGLFLKPTLPSRRSICIPPRKVICLYSTELTTTPNSQIATTDYFIQVERQGNLLCYNVSKTPGVTNLLSLISTLFIAMMS